MAYHIGDIPLHKAIEYKKWNQNPFFIIELYKTKNNNFIKRVLSYDNGDWLEDLRLVTEEYYNSISILPIKL